jgi:pilus assembly protein CpaE
MPEQLRILTAEFDDSLRHCVQDLIRRLDFADLLPAIEPGKDWSATARAVKPDVLLAVLDTANDYGHTLSLVESLKSELPQMAVLFCSANDSAELVLSAMRAGGQEFLNVPINSQDFERALRKVYRAHEQQHMSEVKSGAAISVFSAKGGQGSSSLAVNLAIALGRLDHVDAVLLDLDLYVGDVPGFMDLVPQYDLLDARDTNGGIDIARLQSCMIRHETGVSVLAGLINAWRINEIGASFVKQAIATIRTMFSYTVIDTAHGFDTRTMAALESSNLILVPVTPSVLSVHAARRSLDLLGSLGHDPHKIMVIINRVSKRDSIGPADIEKALDFPIFWRIPNDYKVVGGAVDTGRPFTVGKRLSKVGKNILELADRIDRQLYPDEDWPGPLSQHAGANPSRMKNSE